MSFLTELSQQLKEKKWQLVTAESCTGGLLSAQITEIPGSSLWFERGFITYSNLAKQEMLGVAEQLITQHGAVSEEVAAAMATGALLHSAGHIAVSITGIAGPDGGSRHKPVGLVCFGLSSHYHVVQTIKKNFTGTRQEIRIAACNQAFELILAYIKQIHH